MSEAREQCRVCLRGAGAAGAVNDAQESKFMSLFERLDSSLVAEHIMSLAAVCLAPQDGLPDLICPACLLELRAALDFRAKCEASERALRTSATPKLEPPDIKKEEEPDEFLEELSNCEPLGQDHKFLLSFAQLGDHDSAAKCDVQCHDCGGAFKSKCKLRVHWKREHKQKTFTCPTCKRVLKSIAAFRKHIRSTQQSCKMIESNSGIKVEGEGKSRMFCCTQCDYKSHRFIHIRTHLVCHTPGSKPFKCDLCPNGYSQRGSLMHHKQISHGIGRVSVPCHVCGKIMQSKPRLLKHLKTHTEAKFKCHICLSLLKSKETYNSHMNRHTGQKNVTCELCAATFFTRAELCNHKNYKHCTVKRYFNCMHCDFKSVRKERILKHESKHTEGLLFPCTKCGKFFETLQKLNVHLLRNHQFRKYKCPACPKTFALKKSASKHTKAKHDGLKLVRMAGFQRSVLIGCAVSEDAFT